MGAQSAKQWRCQAPLLLSKSSSHVFPKVGILQSNRRLLSGASWLCNAISRERRSCRRCALWPVSALPAGPGTRRARNWSCAPGAAELGGHGGWPGRGAGAVSQHPVSQTKANSWAWRKFLRAGEDMLPLPQLPSLGNVRAINRAIAPDRCWSLLLNQSDFMGCFAIFFNVVFFFSLFPPPLNWVESTAWSSGSTCIDHGALDISAQLAEVLQGTESAPQLLFWINNAGKKAAGLLSLMRLL